MQDKKDTTLVQIRSVPRRVAARFASGAKARGMTQSEYLQALMELRSRMDVLFDQMLEDDYDPADIAIGMWGAMHDLDLYTHGV